MKSDFRHRNGTSQGVVCGADMLSFWRKVKSTWAECQWISPNWDGKRLALVFYTVWQKDIQCVKNGIIMSWELTTLYKLDIIYSYLDAPIQNLVDVRCGLQLVPVEIIFSVLKVLIVLPLGTSRRDHKWQSCGHNTCRRYLYWGITCYLLSGCNVWCEACQDQELRPAWKSRRVLECK
jgi:hypothetical protein